MLPRVAPSINSVFRAVGEGDTLEADASSEAPDTGSGAARAARQFCALDALRMHWVASLFPRRCPCAPSGARRGGHPAFRTPVSHGYAGSGWTPDDTQGGRPCFATGQRRGCAPDAPVRVGAKRTRVTVLRSVSVLQRHRLPQPGTSRRWDGGVSGGCPRKRLPHRPVQAAAPTHQRRPRCLRRVELAPAVGAGNPVAQAALWLPGFV